MRFFLSLLALCLATSLALAAPPKLKVTDGGTNAGDAPTARANLGAAASGANTDITSLTSGIGVGVTADPSAALHIGGTNKGLLFPRLTTTQMQAISSPANGLTVFNTTDETFEFYNGATWVRIGSQAGGIDATMQFNNLGALYGWNNAKINTTTGALTINNPNAITHSFYITNSIGTPAGETRPVEIYATTTLDADTIWSTFGLSSGLFVNTHGHFVHSLDGSGNPAATHSAGGLFSAQMRDDTPYVAGCTVGVNCPGAVDGLNAGEFQVDNKGTGTILSARSTLIHSPQALAKGGMIERWYMMFNDGCLSGINAEECYGIVSSNTYNFSGFGKDAPYANVQSHVADSASTGTGDIQTVTVGATPTGMMCLIPTYSTDGLTKVGGATGSGIQNGGLVTGSTVAANTHIVKAAPFDQPRDRYCYYLDVAQTVADSTAFTFNMTSTNFLASTYNSASRPGYFWDISHNNSVGTDASLTERYDSDNSNGRQPIGFHLGLSLFGRDTVYFVPYVLNTRGGSMAIGYTDPALIGATDIKRNFQIADKGISSVGGFVESGAPPNILGGSGCQNITFTSTGNNAGAFTANADCTGTIQLNFNQQVGGRSCNVHNETSFARDLHQTAHFPSVVYVTGTMNASDSLVYDCHPFN